jgi:hypothetical protein
VLDPTTLILVDTAQMRELLEKQWTPAGVTLPEEPLIPEVVASLIRMTGGNFRLLARLLTQIERVLSVNDLHLVSNAVVKAARDSLVNRTGMKPTTTDSSEILRHIAIKATGTIRAHTTNNYKRSTSNSSTSYSHKLHFARETHPGVR